MTKTLAQAASFVAASLMTLALFTGTSAAAGHQARTVASAQQAATQDVALEVQHVTIVGHRTPA